MLDSVERLLDSGTSVTQIENISQGRWPDGALALFALFAIPSPDVASGTGDPSRSIRIRANVPTLGRLALAWKAVPGGRYRVKSRSGLEESARTSRVEVLATTASVTLTRPPSPGTPDDFTESASSGEVRRAGPTGSLRKCILRSGPPVAGPAG